MIRTGDLAELTLELCRIPSVIGNEQGIVDQIEQLFSVATGGPPVRRIGNSIVVGRPKIDSRPTIGLFGHLDTVPAHPFDSEARIDGAEIIGLGASDMKCGVAVMLELALQHDQSKLPFNVAYVFYDREEGPYLENGLGPVFEQCPDLNGIDFGICLEPSDNIIQMGCCGSLHAQVKFAGKSAHSARPWQGENAIHKAGPLLTRLHAMNPVEVELQGFKFREVMNATLASGGRARNVIPNEMTININYRFAPNRSLEEAQAEVLRVVGTDAAVEFTDLSPAGKVFADHPLLKRLAELTGAPIESKQAWTDVARLGLHGIPAVNFGPGASAQAHQAGERVAVEQIVIGYRMLARFLGA